MRLAVTLALGALVASCRASLDTVTVHPVERRDHAPRILAVVAHPDDETGFAATLYKAATHLDAVCDVVVVTNGEGGFKYSTLAERIYGVELTEEAVGRAHLPAIRRSEMIAAARLMGLRKLVFLGEQDHRYTQDPQEVLAPDAGVWDLQAVGRALDRVLDEGYDLVLTLAPTPTTHGHHQAVALLTLEAVARLPEGRRPLLLASAPDEDPAAPAPATIEAAPLAPGPPWTFDRTQRFGYRDALDYHVLVNWVIGAHRSQGTMQLAVGGADHERFFAYGEPTAGQRARADRIFNALAEPQFETKTYGAGAGADVRRP